MTKAERLAAKIQRDKETLEKQRLALAESEATLRLEIRQSEAALRDEERKATDKRRYQVGALADEAGLFAWTNAELADVCGARARQGEGTRAFLEAILGDPQRLFRRGLPNGAGRHQVPASRRETTPPEKSLAR